MELYYPHTDNQSFLDIVDSSVLKMVDKYFEHSHFCVQSSNDNEKAVSFFNGMLTFKKSKSGDIAISDTSRYWYKTNSLNEKKVYTILDRIIDDIQKSIFLSVRRKLKARFINDELQEMHLQKIDSYTNLLADVLSRWLPGATGDTESLKLFLYKKVVDTIWQILDDDALRCLLDKYNITDLHPNELTVYFRYTTESRAILSDHPAAWEFWVHYIDEISQYADQSDYQSLGFTEHAWEQALYDYLLSKGLRRHAWKMLLKLDYMLEGAGISQQAISSINTVGQCYEVPTTRPAFNFIKETADRLMSRGERELRGYIARGSHKIVFLNSLIRAVNEGDIDLRNKVLEEDVKNCVDFVRSQSGIMALDSHQQNASLQWWLRQSDQWHAFVQTLKSENKREWCSLVDGVEFEGYTVVALTSSSMLYEEGQLMGNCLASYDARCVTGENRVFSIRLPDKKRPVSDFDLSYQNGVWVINNIVGAFNNRSVDPGLKNIAKVICTLYNEKMSEAFEEHIVSKSVS